MLHMSVGRILYMCVIFLLLMLYTKVCIATVYTVIPDKPVLTASCEGCRKLYYYQRNVKKYFTSNSKFYFGPGEYKVYSDLTLQSIHNISLIGSNPRNTFIKCAQDLDNLVGIKMLKIVNLTLINLTIFNCKAKSQYQSQLNWYYVFSLIIHNCYNVNLQHITLQESEMIFGRLLAVNLLGQTVLAGVTGSELKVYYIDHSEAPSVTVPFNHTLTIYQYTPMFYDYLMYRTMDYETGDTGDSFSYEHDDTNYNEFSYDYNGYRNNLPYDYQYRDNDRHGGSHRNHYHNNDHTYSYVDLREFGFNDVYTVPALIIVLAQNLYGVTVETINTSFMALDYFQVLAAAVNNFGIHRNQIIFENCTFKGNVYTQEHGEMANLINIELFACIITKSNEIQFTGNNIVKFSSCSFAQNYYEGSILNVTWKYKHCMNNESTSNIQRQIIISHCSFVQNKFLHILRLVSSANGATIAHIIGTHFKELNTSVKEYNIFNSPAIFVINVTVLMEGPISFCTINVSNSLIYSNTEIMVTNNITFSGIKSETLISGELSPICMINLIPDVYIHIHNINISNSVFAIESDWYSACLSQFHKYRHKSNMPITLTDDVVEFFPSCFFQYGNGINKSIELVIQDKNNNNIFDYNTGNVNCKFNEGSLYDGVNPLTVHEQHFQLINETGGNIHQLFNTGLLCYCLDEILLDCRTNTIGPLYPGQTFDSYLMLNPDIIGEFVLPIFVKVVDQDQRESVCKVSSLLQAEQLVRNNCTKMTYTILADNEKLCKLILYSIRWRYPTIYYVELQKCPLGFVFSEQERSCICDPILTTNDIIGETDCDINDQTILCPANSWISATYTTYNNSYTYHISLHCPFHYCLPHSSHLNLSTFNSQCQFNRSGVLCGHCQQGLSTVFSSSCCKKCSSIYLLLIIPIIVVGFVLVLLLFFLNLTVTDGVINGFILYANIISINTPVLFPNTDHFTPTYTFISLANLDLGIQTCFYNGMDDYAKMWLQLVFPFYLIFIAILIIIASRYSTTIQRLTARRALPVLATLFLLSYTKILRIVSNILFFYSTITHLPSKHTTLVWSVDANVPLFGVRFTILFIVCLILFLTLVPFNVILLFTRTLSRYRFINKFKPLLDAYQGPYKTDFYYWTGLQLLIRSVLFGISSLDENLNLTISIALFSLIESVQGSLKPFKSEFKNFQERLFLINLTTLYAFLLYNQETNMMVVNIMITIATVHFAMIIVYHIITYVCSAAIKSEVRSSINVIIKKINVLQGKSLINQFELGDSMRCNIPEAVNYHEFRESLLNQL